MARVSKRTVFLGLLLGGIYSAVTVPAPAEARRACNDHQCLELCPDQTCDKFCDPWAGWECNGDPCVLSFRC
jgi:hypothetical protein